MGMMIHARRVEGKIRYRIWSTGSDTYVSEPLSKEEVEEYLWMEECLHLLDELASGGIERRLKRTSKRGTSSRLDDEADLDSPWKEFVENPPDESERGLAFQQETIRKRQAVLPHVLQLLKLLQEE